MKKRFFLLLVICVLCTLFFSGVSQPAEKLSGEEIYANSAGSVFYVRALKPDGTLKTSGSGFVITKEGTALTAAHVVKDAAAVHAVLPSGTEVTVTVEYRDDEFDIAVLKLPSGTDYKFLSLADSPPLPGGTAYAIGYPLKTTKVVNAGVVSNTETPINGLPRLLLNIDYASGMSGGPIINQQGKVMGLCSATVRTMNGESTSPTLEQIREAIAASSKKGE